MTARQEQHCRECQVLRPKTCTCPDLFARREQIDAVAIPLLASALGPEWREGSG